MEPPWIHPPRCTLIKIPVLANTARLNALMAYSGTKSTTSAAALFKAVQVASSSTTWSAHVNALTKSALKIIILTTTRAAASVLNPKALVIPGQLNTKSRLTGRLTFVSAFVCHIRNFVKKTSTGTETVVNAHVCHSNAKTRTRYGT
jgi:hypothetical protein